VDAAQAGISSVTQGSAGLGWIGFDWVLNRVRIGFGMGSKWVRIGFVWRGFRESSGGRKLFMMNEIRFGRRLEIGFVLKIFVFGRGGFKMDAVMGRALQHRFTSENHGGGNVAGTSPVR
jgi:hypothetical protein